MTRLLFLVLLAFTSFAIADEVSLRLGGKEIGLTPQLGKKVATLAREALARCGPNTTQHPGNFGLAALGVEGRWKGLAEGSRLRRAAAAPARALSRDLRQAGARRAGAHRHAAAGHRAVMQLIRLFPCRA